MLLRVDSAGATHELLDWCREASIRFSVGYDLTETVRTAILNVSGDAWVAAVDQDATARPNGLVCEITSHLDLAAWPEGSRVLVRRERAHPGAQLNFTDQDGHRFQAILTDQTTPVLGTPPSAGALGTGSTRRCAGTGSFQYGASAWRRGQLAVGGPDR